MFLLSEIQSTSVQAQSGSADSRKLMAAELDEFADAFSNANRLAGSYKNLKEASWALGPTIIGAGPALGCALSMVSGFAYEPLAIAGGVLGLMGVGGLILKTFRQRSRAALAQARYDNLEADLFPDNAKGINL